MTYKFYYNEGMVGVKNYRGLVTELKKDKRKYKHFLMELAGTYGMFKSLLKMRDMKLLKFREDGMEEDHIKFVDKLKKSLPELERYIKKSSLSKGKQNGV